jgi:shikimate dehydrogenase
MMPRLGVLGWPVAHSRSPAMHNAALQALGMRDWRYQLLPVAPELFAETVPALGQAGFVGANVTIPHKHAALALADSASAAAREIGAANTLSFARDGSLAADNTDAPGLLAALGFSPRAMSALVLGAGGAARAAVWALREAGAQPLAVWNRTAERAAALADELAVEAVSAPRPADLLVNCTSVGLQAQSAQDQLAQLGLTSADVARYPHVADLAYGPEPTALIAAARAHRVRAVGGLEILLRQGALSFELWTGIAAPLDVMRGALRDRSDGA